MRTVDRQKMRVRITRALTSGQAQARVYFSGRGGFYRIGPGRLHDVPFLVDRLGRIQLGRSPMR